MISISEICKVNISFVLALVGFDVAIIAIIMGYPSSWSLILEAAGALLAGSVFSLTFSFFVYHTLLTTEQQGSENAVRLLAVGNRWTELGVFCLIVTVPVLLLNGGHYAGAIVSLVGLVWILYHFLTRRI
ncbi:MAG TPA: hypothetical protein VEG61_00600 [Candidatus Dormibacteraeota bacterium]|nr:hypothetical protein [Candidatus Dormibacteraeota bacterium]